MKQIKLSNSNKVVLVDDEDFERLSKFTWKLADNCVQRSHRRYGKKNVSLASEVMHRLETMFDHKNRDSLDNQKQNLREATYSQNAMNRTKQQHCTSAYKGVSKFRNKWKAKIGINGKQIYLGIFNTEVEAAKAYNQKAIELFKEFACLNQFPAE